MGGVAGPPAQAVASGGGIALDADEPKNLAHRILERVTAQPNGVVRSCRQTDRHQTQSRSDLWRRSADVAAALAYKGAQPSTPVVILAEDVLDFLPAFWACLRGGFLAVPLMSIAKNASYRDENDFNAALSLLKGYFVLADDEFVALSQDSKLGFLENVIPLSLVPSGGTWVDRDLAPGHPACLVGTSGSTGRFKLVELSHSALIYRNFDTTRTPWAKGSHALGTFALDTVTGQHAIYLHTDALTQLSTRTISARPTAILEAIEQFGISTLNLTSSMIARILNEEHREKRSRDLGCLQSIGVGGEPIAIRVIHDFARLLESYGGHSNILGAGYGTTETGALALGSRDLLTASPLSAVCLGPPRAGVKLRVVGEDRSIISSGETGELEVFCPEKMFSGYWEDAALTSESFTGDGWWKTGDLGQLIEGKLYLHGRAKEVFIQNGKKFSFSDIDNEMQNALAAGDVAHAFTATCPDGSERLAVLFAVTEPSRADGLADRIRNAVIRRFGLYPDAVFQVGNQLIPRTAAGKLRRGLLNAVFTDRARPSVETPQALPSRERLEAIWNNALDATGPVATEAHFLNLGGDSMRSLSLHKQIIAAFGIHISSEEFFANPTFETLLRLVENRRAAPSDGVANVQTKWPLPKLLNNNLLIALESWQGVRSTSARTMLAKNTAGAKPPLFWVFNTKHEFDNLARALGADQPLYAFRSGVLITDYGEDDIQALALRYLSDIMDVCPEGPFFIGGNCQGGIIALAMAEHALRRKRHVPLLVLMDWSFALQPFAGHVLLVSGSDNFDHNAARRFKRPDLAWKRAFASYEFVEIPGGYAQGFDEGKIEALVQVLTSRMQSVLAAPTILHPASGYRATVDARDVPRTLKVSRRAVIKVSVGQESEVAWGRTEQSGIVVGSRWLDASGQLLKKVGPIAEVPEMAPHSSVELDLVVVAPENPGKYTLNIELCEDGNRWFRRPEMGFSARVSVRKSIAMRLGKPWTMFLGRLFGT